DLLILDTTDPARPRARSLSAALARIVRSRAANPKFIAGQLRHGPRGAAELAETVDRLVDFAETTGAVASHLFALLDGAYVADDGLGGGRRRAELPAAGDSCGSCRHRVPPRRGTPARALASSAQRRRRKLANAHERGGAVNAHLRRGICPGLSRPMATGDGLL